jgi:hypothetical protein
MNPNAFLLLNLAFGFYNVGTIWAHWVRTLLANASAMVLLVWAIMVLS